ncbi:hypothetical protein BDW59DRAFT_163916 [Aspergillus cavernicola]|uniref:Uncharacterized protein n=1 Tax=Aspergillus cavernicola TaxID=176166 RepID=A0ABR4I321_9EURO
MATQRFPPRSQSQSQTPAFIHRVLDYELGGDQELASSQPVSLIQLYSKTNPSRNRAARNSKVLHPDTADEMMGDASFHGVNKHEPSSRFSLLHHPNTVDYRLSDDTGHLTPPPQHVSQEYAWQHYGRHSKDAQDQAWHLSQGDYHTQKNPLNYACYYNLDRSREGSCLSESPFLRKTNPKFPEREAWRVDITPVSQRHPFDTPQSSIYAQKEYMPAPSLQIYRASFDRPHDKSPYESFRLKHRNNRTDLPEITSGLQYGCSPELKYEHHTGNTTIRSEPTLSTHFRERLPNFETAPHSREAQAALELQDSSALGSRISSGTSIAHSALKEIYALLDNMNVGSSTDPKPTSTSQGSESMEKEPAIAHDQVKLDDRPGPESLVTEARGKSKRKYSTPKEGNSDEPYICRRETTIGKGEPHPNEPSPPPDPGVATTSPEPPPLPGLFDLNDILAPGTSRLFWKTASTQPRFEEADTWFHKDGRGEDQLRHHISNIAENFVDRSERLGTQSFSAQDRITTKQTISLIGNVIANLHSYAPKDRRDPARYFADFRPVDPRYCGLSFGGRRSYFEDDATRMEGAALDCGID